MICSLPRWAVTVERLRGIVARWRKAGLAQTGTLMSGPAWCWLSAAGMKATGLGYPAARRGSPQTVETSS